MADEPSAISAERESVIQSESLRIMEYMYQIYIYKGSLVRRLSHRPRPINQLFPRETFILLHSVTKFPRRIVRKYILCSFLSSEIDSVNGREKVGVCFYCDNGRLGVYREIEKLVKRFENRSIWVVIWHYQFYFSIPSDSTKYIVRISIQLI